MITNVHRWVQHFAPIVEKERRAKLQTTKDSWRVVEIYVTARTLLEESLILQRILGDMALGTWVAALIP